MRNFKQAVLNHDKHLLQDINRLREHIWELKTKIQTTN